MGLLATQEISQSGLAPSFAAASAEGDSFVNDDRTFLHVKNAGGSEIDVTIVAQRTSFDIPGLGTVTFADIVVAVPATTGERMIKAPQGPYSDGNGRAQVLYESTTSVTVAAIKMPGG